MPPNDFFATTGSSGYVGKALIGTQPQTTGYPKGVSITTPFPTQALTKLWAMVAAATDGTTVESDIFDASGYFFGEPLAAGSGGPGQFTFSPAAETDSGDTFSYLQVNTLTNDFSITESSDPWMVGSAAGSVVTVIGGPTAVLSATKTMVAAGDGTVATVVQTRFTGNNGMYVLKEAV